MSTRILDTVGRIGKSVLAAIVSVERWILIVTLGVMVLSTAIAILFRIINISFPAAEELTRYTMIWLISIGAAYATYYLGHIEIGILPLVLKQEKIRLVIKVVVNLICAVTLCFFVVWFYSLVAGHARDDIRWQAEPLLPLAPMTASFVIGLALASMHFIINMIKDISKLASYHKLSNISHSVK